jgi:hypothetical protein
MGVQYVVARMLGVPFAIVAIWFLVSHFTVDSTALDPKHILTRRK